MKAMTLILTTLLLTSIASADVKIGYVDMQKAISQTKSGKKAFDKLQKVQKSKQTQLDKKKKEIEGKRASLEKKMSVWSNEKKMQEQQKFQREVIEAEKLFRQSQLELAKEEENLLKPVLTGLREAISKYAKKEGYTMILERAGGTVLFASDDADLTAKVVKAYGK